MLDWEGSVTTLVVLDNMSQFDATWSAFVISVHKRENIEQNNIDVDYGNQTLCDFCMLPIFSTPYVRIYDRQAAHFLHKSCANFPSTITDHPLHFPNTLKLRSRPITCAKLPCQNCDRECGAMYYKCWLDVICGATVRIVHRSHTHELTPIRRSGVIEFSCGACGSKDKGEFYGCELCAFYIHHSCASLPNTILHQDHNIDDDVGGRHLLCLSFFLPQNSVKFKKCERCSICNRLYSESEGGLYFCTSCDYSAHIKCTTLDPKTFSSRSTKDALRGLIHFPMANEQTSFLSRLLPKIKDDSSAGAEGKRLCIQNIHDHDLLRHDTNTYSVEEASQSYFVCHVCIRPISPPFYSCSECNDFFIHSYCANLPSESQFHPDHDVDCDHQPLVLIPKVATQFFSVFWCRGSKRYSNGVAYTNEKCGIELDAEGGLLPEAITHEFHGKSHVLFLSSKKMTYTSWLHNSSDICYCCTGMLGRVLYYECCTCPSFKLDVHCALLPSTVSHKFDRLPLKLSSPDFYTPHKDVHFCEICEKSMRRGRWSYHCEECATYFHIDCIPCVGRLSKIKFGGSIRVKNHIGCRLTPIRLLTDHTYICGRCKQPIEGRREEFYENLLSGIAFECIKCCFWLHYDCAEKEWIRS